ncbi:MAG: hypothetical protein WCS34_07360, partial [Bacteroidales bacterium]
MKVLNNIVSGASRQFGREFGRAGANIILKGANSYTIKHANSQPKVEQDYDNDQIAQKIEELNNLKFASTNKENVSILIDITDTIISNLEFKGNTTLNELSNINELVNQYNEKFNHGSSLVDDDFKDKSIDYLHKRRKNFVAIMDKFNNDMKDYVSKNLEIYKSKRKSKAIAVLLGIPLLGLQFAYLRLPAGYTIMSILLYVTVIVPLINLFLLLVLLFMSRD